MLRRSKRAEMRSFVRRLVIFRREEGDWLRKIGSNFIQEVDSMFGIFR